MTETEIKLRRNGVTVTSSVLNLDKITTPYVMVKLPFTHIKCIACLTIKSPPTFFWFFSLHRIYITLKFVCDIGSRWSKNLHLKLCYVRFLLSDWLFTNFQLTRVLKNHSKIILQCCLYVRAHINNNNHIERMETKWLK